ncbi:MAG: metal-sensing transcriptional repressor [Egibacteraceae bacterium]
MTAQAIFDGISAASRALDQVGFTLLATGLRHCAADEESARAAGYSTDELERLFLKLV